MKIERSIIRRDATRPDLAEGERTLFEMDPERVAQTLREARQLVRALDSLFHPRPKRRARRRP